MSSDELSLDFIESLLAQPEPTRRTSRKPKVDERNINTWFKVEHTGLRSCEVKTHDEVVAAAGKAGRPRDKGVTTIIGDIAVCRICFLVGADKSDGY